MFEKLRNYSRIIVYIVVVAFAVGGGFMGYGAFSGGGDAPADRDAMDALAQVGEREITRQRYNEVIQNYAQQTANFTRAQMLPFRLSVLNSIIDETILIQEAEARGLDPQVSPDEIDEVINNILEQNNMEMEELEDILAQQNITLNQFQDNIRNSLRQQNMMEEIVEEIQDEAEVTDSEVAARFEDEYEDEDLDEQEQEEAKEDIRANLLEERREEKLNDWLQEARADANVTINDPVLRAMNYYEEENYTAALNTFEEALERSRDPALYIFKARTYREMDQIEDAYSVLDRAQEEHPEEWEIAYEHGDFLAEEGEDELAVEKFEKASEYAGRNIMARYQLNTAFTRVGAEELAQEEMDKFMEIQQDRQEIAPEGTPLEEDELEEVDPDEVEVEPEQEPVE